MKHEIRKYLTPSGIKKSHLLNDNFTVAFFNYLFEII